MSELFDKSLRQVLEVSASKEPTPGGGSVAAIAGGFAAAMTAMVTNLTIGKKRYKDVEGQIKDIREKAMGLIKKAEKLVEADMAVFTRFMDCYKISASTPEEKEEKDKLIQEALKGATEVPLAIGKMCLDILSLVDEIAPIGSKMAISDAGVAAYLAEAGLQAALLNVDINVPQIKDEEFVNQALEQKKGLIAKAKEIKERSTSTVSRRIGGA